MEIIEEYKNMIKNAWTFQRLTEDERTRFLNLLSHPCTTNALKYSHNHKWDILNAMYHAYLEALEYQPIGWREEKEQNNQTYEDVVGFDKQTELERMYE